MATLVFDINPATGMWQDAGRTTPATADNAAIAAADDQSGNGYNSVAADATLKTNIQNGKPAIRFAVGKYLDFGNILNGVWAGADSKFTVIAVLTGRTAGDTNDILVKNADSNWSENQRQFVIDIESDFLNMWQYKVLTSGNYKQWGATGTALGAGPYVLAVGYDGAQDTLNGEDRMKPYVNGRRNTAHLGYSAGTLGDIQSGTARLGVNRGIGSAGGLRSISPGTAWDLLRLVVYDNLLTGSEFVKVQDELADLYGIDIGQTINQDAMLDNAKTKTITGLTFSQNTPTKDGGNPIFPSGTNTDTWDNDKEWPGALIQDNAIKLHYLGITDTPPYPLCYATASPSDPKTFTKPNLGQVSYGGNTNNNICFAEHEPTSVFYDSVTDKFYCVGANTGVPSAGVYIYSSDDGMTGWTLIKTLSADGSNEGHEIIRLQSKDGYWAIFVTSGHSAQTRYLHAFFSQTTNPAGNWFERGIIFPCTTATTDQKYHVDIHYWKGRYWAYLHAYNKTTEKIFKVDLLCSFNATDWSPIKLAWLEVGAGSAWDSGMIDGVSPPIEINNEWIYYYGATPSLHNGSAPRDNRIGIATLSAGRLGGIGTTGSFITGRLKAGDAGQHLVINADASGGSIQAEILDPVTLAPIADYELADCNTVSSDTYGTELKWGANAVPAGDYRIKFYLTDATLYTWELGAEPPAPPAGGTSFFDLLLAHHMRVRF
jgi:hypothetical protein